MAIELVVARAAVAITTALTLMVAPAAPLLAQAPPASTPPASPAPAKPATPATAAKPATGAPAAAKPAAAPQPHDGGWPRGYVTASGAKIVVYQPQVASWDDQKHAVVYAAVSHDTGAPKPALGSLKLEADTKVSVAERLVNFSDFKITEANFPTLTKERISEVVAEIEKAIPHDDRVIGLDRVLASVDSSQIIPKKRGGREGRPAHRSSSASVPRSW